MTSELVRTGTSLRRGSRFEPLRAVSLAAAAAVFVLSLVAAVAVVATYDGWAARNHDRSPRPHTVFTAEEPVALWASVEEATTGAVPYDVVYLAPLVNHPPLPPGLDRWPGPGEVVASPAMLGTAEVAPVGREGRYGTTVGTIAVDGLVEAHERLVYVGADGLLSDDNARVVTGFGDREEAGARATGDAPRFGVTLGAATYQEPIALLLWVVAVLLALPAAWFTVTSVRVGATRRARAVATLTLLGARPRQVRAVLWGECRGALVTGWAAAVAVTAGAMLVDVPLPGAAFTLRAEDLRASWSLVVLAVAVGMASTAALAVSGVGLSRERRRTEVARRAPTFARAALVLVVASLTVICVNLTIARGLVDVIPLAFGAGMLATLACLPSSTRAALVLVAGRWRRRAWRSGDPGGVVGAGQLAAAPAPAARFGATAAILIVLVAFVYSFAQALGSVNRDFRADGERGGSDVAFVRAWAQADEARWAAALGSLRQEHAVVERRTSQTDSASGPRLETRLVGDRRDLDALGLASSDGLRNATWTRFDPLLQEAEVQVGDVAAPRDVAPTELVVARLDGGPIDMVALRDALAGMTTPTWQAALPTEPWLVGSTVSVHQSRWVTWFGAIGMLCGFAALWISYSNELLRAVRSLLAVQVMAPDGTFVAEALLWRIVAPVSVAVVGGSGLALLLIWPLTNADYRLPTGFTFVAALVAVGTGLVAWLVTWRACTTAAERTSLGVTEE